MAYCHKFRPLLPPHYNDRRQFDQPVPSLNPLLAPTPSQTNGTATSVATNTNLQATTSSQTNDATTSDATNANLQADNEQEQKEHEDGNEIITDAEQTRNETSSPESFDESTADNETQQTEDAINESVRNISAQNDTSVNEPQRNVTTVDNCDDEAINTSENDVQAKHILLAVDVDADDELALNHLFDDDGTNMSNSNESDGNNELNSREQPVSGALAGIVLEENEKADVQNGKVIITKEMADDLQMIYTFGETPRPLLPLYNVKMNDIISGDIPFKENVHNYI